MNNKGQDLSLTTIILAALGLIILVVLAAVFTGRIGSFGVSLGQLEANTQCSQFCKDMPGENYVSGVMAKENPNANSYSPQTMTLKPEGFDEYNCYCKQEDASETGSN